MIEFQTQIKKWGNSFGMIIPKEEIKKGVLKEDDKVIVLAVKKTDTAKKTFGLMKGWKLTGQQAKDTARRELYND